jgi:hypothetical protein
VFLLLSTPAFVQMLGAAKADNAAAQYGIVAFLWITLSPILGPRAFALGGLCLGWALAARFTNIILIPGFAVFIITLIVRQQKPISIWEHFREYKRFWLTTVSIGATAALLTTLPLLIKNWLLVGCPLAPFVGCRGQYWADFFVTWDPRNLSLSDLLLYPFIWTFAHRNDMLGNISPLFIGLLPLLLAYRAAPVMTISPAAGLAGLASLVTWLLLHPFYLYTRFLLVPLALIAVCLSASAIAAEAHLRRMTLPRYMFRSAMVILLLFLFFQSREVVYAIRYVASIDKRETRYQATPGFDVATWINANVVSGQRVSLAHWRGYEYFVNLQPLLNSESQAERQQLWQNYRVLKASSWTEDLWRFYIDKGFEYVAVPSYLVKELLTSWPEDIAYRKLRIAFEGRKQTVFRLEGIQLNSLQ